MVPVYTPACFAASIPNIEAGNASYSAYERGERAVWKRLATRLSLGEAPATEPHRGRGLCPIAQVRNPPAVASSVPNRHVPVDAG